MQLYAIDEKDELIFAENAFKQKNYICIECKGIVRRRSGNHRKTHYYHLSDSNCKLSQKSLIHIQVQSFIQKTLSAEELFLEYRFSKINRIADVAWLNEKIIFEVQYSPITAEEVKKRNQDYQSEGYQVIWILHDRTFNQKTLTAAEKYLRDHPYYYTNMTSEGKGFIYDQFDLNKNGFRKNVLSPFPIKLNEKKEIELEKSSEPFFKERMKKKIYFGADLLHLYLCKSLSQEQLSFIEALQHPSCNANWTTHFKKLLHKTIIHPYMIIFRMILEKVCK